MKNAIGSNQCGGCKFFHTPQGNGKVGVCVRYPPTPFLMGMAPTAGVLDPKGGQNVQPIVRAYYPVLEAISGCGEWQPVLSN